ncbi:MAG: hypothetical protein HOP13_16005, partial [Alphaproteobacteria bacterium]|nr:hypothetical protein [Alphaproteobacteria bacterium]
SYEVVGEAPVTSEFRLETLEPERVRRATVIKVDGVDLPAAEQSYETFAVSPGANGTDVNVEAAIPVRGWLWVPVHRRYLGRIYEDLRMACLRQAGVPFEAYERRWWFWTVKRS